MIDADSKRVYVPRKGDRVHRLQGCAGPAAEKRTWGEVKDEYEPCGTCAKALAMHVELNDG